MNQGFESRIDASIDEGGSHPVGRLTFAWDGRQPRVTQWLTVLQQKTFQESLHRRRILLLKSCLALSLLNGKKIHFVCWFDLKEQEVNQKMKTAIFNNDKKIMRKNILNTINETKYK